MKKYLFLLLFCLLPSLSYSATYWADKDAVGGACSDSGACTLATAPCCGINAALGKVTGGQANTINIRSDGNTEYAEYINPTSTKNGIEGGFLTIQGYSTEDPDIVGALSFSGTWNDNTPPRYVTNNNDLAYTPKLYIVTCSGTDTLMDSRTATSAATVDTNGEWWYDSTNKRAFARMPGGVNPTSCSHRFAQYPTNPDTWNALFYIQSNYTLIQNLNIKYSNAGGIVGGMVAGAQGQFLQVKNVDVQWTYQAGIKGPNRDYTYFYNNTVDRAVAYKFLDTTSSLGSAPEPMSMQKGDYNVAQGNTITNSYFMGCPSIGEGADSTNDTPNDSISIGNSCTSVEHITYTNRGWRNRFQNNIGVEGGENIYLSPEPSKIANNKYNTYIGNRLKGGDSCVRLLTYTGGGNTNKSYNNLLAHNTCYDTDKGIWSQNTSTTIYDNEFKNNIISGHSGNPIIMAQNGNPSDNVWSYNLHYSDAVLTKYYDQAGVTYQNANGQTAFNSWKTAMSPQAQNDIWGNPLFVDLTDFVLQSGSPAINAGTGLTTVTSQAGTCTAGSSTTIKVANADWFHEEWGNDGTGDADPSIITGDSIRIYTPGGGGTDQTRTVSSVSYAANEAESRVGTITVTSALSCAANDIIDYEAHFIGTAPDMGAMEYNAVATTCDTPTLDAVTSPTGASTQLISGTKTGNPQCSIWLNGTEVVPLDSSTSWSYLMSLATGDNPISITSKNAQGTETSATTGNIVKNAPPVKSRYSGVECS